ncbi:P2 family phage major capsid protein [Escherichia coli]
MRQETRFKFNAYLSRVAELNGIDAGDVSKKFTVEPSVTQTLMNTMQESSDFLTRINIVPVSEMKGEKIGIGVTGSIASTTDTAGGTERQPKDFSKLASNKYECDQINFDFYIRYKTLDLWARYQDFQLRVRNAIIKRQSLDFIMAGFNGVRRAETSDRSSNPMLQDVAVGWLQKYRNEAPARVMSKVTDEEGHTTSEVIRVGKGGDYASLDALVMDATNNLIVAVVAAIVAGALLIRKYWEPVSAFFGGVMEGLKAAFAPVGELFTPLKPVFDWLGEKLQAAWQWFKNLIAPVKATQDTLNRCRDTGVMFGQALADALMLPLNAFNKLRSGIDWVLEKLGVINKESDTLDQTAARTQAATYGSGGYIPATSSYADYQAYQPVTAPAGRSYVDQSKNEYHISLTGGTAPGTQLDRQLQDALEKYERDKRARARASMMHDG